MKTNYEVGQKVEIAGNTNFHGLEIGSVHTITDANYKEHVYKNPNHQTIKLGKHNFLIRSTDVKPSEDYRGFKVFISDYKENALVKTFEFDKKVDAIKKAIYVALNNSIPLNIGVAYYDAKGMHAITRDRWLPLLVSDFGGVQLDLETKEYETFCTTR
jgi:hypothetical protein